MQERNVTVGNPCVSATSSIFRHCDSESDRNDGTYPLPEAQLDRFLFKLKVEFPVGVEFDRDFDAHDDHLGADRVPRRGWRVAYADSARGA